MALLALKALATQAENDPNEPIEVDLLVTGGGLKCFSTLLIGDYINLHKKMIFKRASGASSGAAVAAFCLCESGSIDIVDNYRKYKDKKDYIVNFLRKLLEESLPENAHEICQDRLFVAITEIFPFRRHIISRFYSRQDLIDCICAGCHIPYFTQAGPYALFRGMKCLDGILPYQFNDNLRPIFKINLINIEGTFNEMVNLSNPLIHHIPIKGFDEFLLWYLKGKRSNIYQWINAPQNHTSYYKEKTEENIYLYKIIQNFVKLFSLLKIIIYLREIFKFSLTITNISFDDKFKTTIFYVILYLLTKVC
jgi:hypothetical protein